MLLSSADIFLKTSLFFQNFQITISESMSFDREQDRLNNQHQQKSLLSRKDFKDTAIVVGTQNEMVLLSTQNMHFTNELENYNNFNEVHLDLNLRVCNQNKPSVLFVGHRQTEQTLIQCCRTRRLIRVSTVYLQNYLLKIE